VDRDFGAAKVVIFNGHQNPDSLVWGYIAEKLDREATHRHALFGQDGDTSCSG
jgi:hypothetical protein